MKRFYHYLIYKLYSWRLAKKDDTPIATVIFLLSMTHGFQLLIICSLMGSFFPQVSIFDNLSKIYVGIFFILFIISHYFLFYNKILWQQYLEEFKDETKLEKRKGNIQVITYLLGSVVLFFVLLPLLFGL